MIARRLIPCLDVSAGRVVKGVRFVGLRDAGDPLELARRYEAEGADELVVLDVSATVEGRGHALETLRALRGALGIPICAGGGVRCLADAEALLYAGADKGAVNTAAWRDPGLIRALAARFGSQATVLALDARRRPVPSATQDESGGQGGYEVVVAAGREATGADAVEWARRAAALGAGELLVTSIDRDGTHSGYELPLIAALAQAVSVPIVASGGARDGAHMAAALEAGASAVLCASILHDGLARLSDLKQQLSAAGLPIRPC